MSDSFVVGTLSEKLKAFCQISRQEPSCSHLAVKTRTYKDFMGTSLEQTLINAFPLTHRLLKEEGWANLLQAFLTTYDKHSPYFWQFPKGLVEFVRENGIEETLGLPCLKELMDFEWLEVEMYMQMPLPREEYSLQGDLMQDVLYVNPDHRLKTYAYPVFSSSSMDKGTYHLLCFRVLKTGEVRVIPLTSFYREVFEHVAKGEATGKEAIQKVAHAHNRPLTQELLTEGREFFQNLLSQEALLGFQQ